MGNFYFFHNLDLGKASTNGLENGIWQSPVNINLYVNSKRFKPRLMDWKMEFGNPLVNINVYVNFIWFKRYSQFRFFTVWTSVKSQSTIHEKWHLAILSVNLLHAAPLDFIPGPTVGAFVRPKSFAEFLALELIKYNHDVITQLCKPHAHMTSICFSVPGFEI